MTALKPNVVIYLIDDMDLERVPFYPRLDKGAMAQLEVHRRGNACQKGLANCTYSAPNIESIGERGVRFLGAHVPVSVCTPSRYALLTGRLPSSAPFYSGTHTGHFDAEGTVDISWNTFISQGTGPLCSRQRPRGCERRAQTLGDMLHRASCICIATRTLHGTPHTCEVYPHRHTPLLGPLRGQISPASWASGTCPRRPVGSKRTSGASTAASASCRTRRPRRARRRLSCSVATRRRATGPCRLLPHVLYLLLLPLTCCYCPLPLRRARSCTRMSSARDSTTAARRVWLRVWLRVWVWVWLRMWAWVWVGIRAGDGIGLRIGIS